MGVAGTGVALEGRALAGDAATGSAFMLRPVAEDQLVIILVMSARKGEFVA